MIEQVTNVRFGSWVQGGLFYYSLDRFVRMAENCPAMKSKQREREVKADVPTLMSQRQENTPGKDLISQNLSSLFLFLKNVKM